MQAEALSELEVLDHRKVQINKTRATNRVPAHVAEVSGRRWRYRRPALDVASEFSQLINCGLVPCCRNALGIAANHMFIIGIKGVNVVGIAASIGRWVAGVPSTPSALITVVP